MQWYFREFELPKNWPEVNFSNLENRKFENVRFSQLYVFDIPLLVNLFISFIEYKVISIEHPWKEYRCKFKIDKLTYSKS